MSPADLRYSSEHEWLRLEAEGVAVIGITEFAAESLGDVVFVELPQVDSQLTQFEKMGEIESVKAVSELCSPISGRVIECNERLADHPELVNEEPYQSGWMMKLKLNDVSQTDKLMTADQYDAFVASQE